MAMRVPTAPLPLIPLAVAEITVVSVVAIALATVFGVDAVGDEFMQWVLPPMLFFIGVLNAVISRVSVFPQMFRRFREDTSAEPQAVTQIANSARIVLLAFAAAPSIYGLVAVVFTGLWWLPIPFAALAFFILFLNNTYIDNQVRALELEARTRGA